MNNNESHTKQSFRFPLRIILIVPFVLQVVLIMGLTGYSSYVNGQKAVNAVAEQFRCKILTRIEERLHIFINTPLQINRINSMSINDGLLASEARSSYEHHFWEQIQIFDSVTSIYYANADGNIVGGGREGPEGSLYTYSTDPNDGSTFNKYSTDPEGNHAELLVSIPDFDARTRAWYINAKENGDCVWNDIYILATEQDMAIAVSCPVHDEHGDFLGVVSIDIFLSHIDEYLSQLAISESGQSFIIERSGLLVASSSSNDLLFYQNQSDRLERRRADENATPIIRHAAGFLLDQYGSYQNIPATVSHEFKIDGDRHFLHISPIQNEYGLDWLVGIVVPESDFMSQIHRNTQITLFILAIAVLLSIFISIFTARMISEPIYGLNRFAKALTEGDWEQTVPANNSIREIDDLAQSSQNMAEQLKFLLDNLTIESEERKQAEQSLRLSELHYRSLIEDLPVLVCRFLPDGTITFANTEYCKFHNKSAEEIIGQNFLPLVMEEDRETTTANILSITRESPLSINLQRVIDPEGNVRWQRWTNRGLFDEDGQLTSYHTLGEDITERKKAEDDLKFMARHDMLTQLPNRTMLDDRLDHALHLAHRNNKRVAILFLDLDGFKNVNDAFGHKEGDRLLQTIAQRLLKCVRKSDTVARLGGDEFGIILEDVSEVKDTLLVIKKIIQAVAQPFIIQDIEVFVTASIGISIYPDDSEDPIALIQHADHAMYRAKGNGKNGYQFFSFRVENTDTGTP